MKKVTGQKSVFVFPDDLIHDSRELIEETIEGALNGYIQKTRTVSINGVNLIDVDGAGVYLYPVQDEKNKFHTVFGLLFLRNGDRSQGEFMKFVDAAKISLCLQLRETGEMCVIVEVVDKQGRRV